jgi:hypothetical protein
MSGLIVACTVEEVLEDVTHWTHIYAPLQKSVPMPVGFVDVPLGRKETAANMRKLMENEPSLLCYLLKETVQLCTTVHCVDKCMS